MLQHKTSVHSCSFIRNVTMKVNGKSPCRVEVVVCPIVIWSDCLCVRVFVCFWCFVWFDLFLICLMVCLCMLDIFGMFVYFVSLVVFLFACSLSNIPSTLRWKTKTWTDYWQVSFHSFFFFFSGNINLCCFSTINLSV